MVIDTSRDLHPDTTPNPRLGEVRSVETLHPNLTPVTTTPYVKSRTSKDDPEESYFHEGVPFSVERVTPKVRFKTGLLHWDPTSEGVKLGVLFRKESSL